MGETEAATKTSQPRRSQRIAARALANQNSEMPVPSLVPITTVAGSRSTALVRRSSAKRGKPRSQDPSTEEQPQAKKTKRVKKKQDNSAATVPTPEVPSCCICLHSISRQDLSKINCCSHLFCFACIETWSKIQNQCPLCKQRFARISRVHPLRTSRSGAENELDVPDRNGLAPSRNPRGFAFSFYLPVNEDALSSAVLMFRQLAPSLGIDSEQQERTIQRFVTQEHQAASGRGGGGGISNDGESTSALM